MLELRLKYAGADEECFTTIRGLAVAGGVFDQFRQRLEQLAAKTGYDKTSGIEHFGRNFTWHIGKTEVKETQESVERLK